MNTQGDVNGSADGSMLPQNPPKMKLSKRIKGFFSKRAARKQAAAERQKRETGMENTENIPGKEKKARRFFGAAAKAIGKAVDGMGFCVAFGTAAVGSLILFRLLNKTKVYGLKNIPSQHENVLYCINHNSLLDNFIFEVGAYVPKVLFRPEYLPVNLADRKNFFGDPSSRKLRDRVMRILGRHFFRHLKAYPVDRRTGDMGQVEEWSRLLKENIVIVYPEGTRSRTGKVGGGKPGVGKLIHEARPIVMPVFMDGTAAVLGVGMKIPTVFKTIKIYIGEPMDLSPLFIDDLPDDRRSQMIYYKKLSDAVMDEIRELDPTYRKEDGTEQNAGTQPSDTKIEA